MKMKRYFIRDAGDGEILGVVVDFNQKSANALFHDKRNQNAFCPTTESFMVAFVDHLETPVIEFMNRSVA